MTRHTMYYELRIIIAFAMILGVFTLIPPKPALAFAGDYAIGFDGINDYVRSGLVSDVFGSGWRDTKAISVWVRPLGDPACGIGGAGNQSPIVNSNSFWFGIARGKPQAYGCRDAIWVWNWDGNEDYIEIPYTPGEWVHITLVHSGGFLYGYKNGQLMGSKASGSTSDIPGLRMSFGGSYTENHRCFQGQIDEVAFWRASLSQQTIREWMYRELDGSHPNWASIGAYYKMQPGMGSAVTDHSGNGFTGTLTDGPTWVASGAFAGPRYSLDFDGVNDYASVPASINIPSALTLEAWVYPRNISAGEKWIAGEVGGARLTMDGTTLRFYVHNGTSELGPATATLAANQWQHIAGVYDGTDPDPLNHIFQVYVNAVPGVASVPNGGNTDQGGTFNLASPNGVTMFNHLLVDEVRLWSSSRPQAQVAADMAQTLNPQDISISSNVIAYYRMDTRGDAVLYDLSSNNNHGTTSGMTTGTSTSRTNNTITQSGAGWAVNQFATMFIEVTSGNGAGQFRDIISNTSDTILVSPNWVVNPPTGSNFRIYYSTKSVAFNTWIGADSSDWATSGNWSLNQVPSLSDNVGVYSHPNGNYANITTGVGVGNLTVGQGGELAVANGAGIIVSGNLYNSGTLRRTQAVSGDGDIGFFNTGNYGGLLLDPNTDDLGITTVTIRGNQDCTNAAGDTVQRCFDITPAANDTGIGKTVTFFFDQSEESGNDCDLLNAYHYTGSLPWSLLTLSDSYGIDGRLCGTDPRSVQVVGVTAFSPFALNEGDSPTAIELVSFSGTSRSANFILATALGIALALLGVVLWLRRRQNAG